MPTLRVGISLGNTEERSGGLGEFSLQLGLALAARGPGLREAYGIELHLHCRPSLHGCFGPDVHHLPVQRSQELRHSAPVNMDLWHSLNQLNRYGPPHGQGLRLVTVHDLNYLYERRGLSRWRHGWRYRQLLARQQGVVTISQHVADDVQRELRWRGALQVIHNGVRDLSQAPQEAVPGLQPGGYFFHISRLTPSKNVEALLAMMALWPERQLVLAGPDARRNDELQALLSAKGLRNVRILTRVGEAQKAWLYAQCAAFFFPSLTEGFGLPPIEAMYFGKPVFLSDRTSLPEVGGTAARYWPSFEPVAMRAVVEAGLQQHDAERADAVRRHASRFNWTDAAEAYVDVYLRMLRRAGRLPVPWPLPPQPQPHQRQT